MVKIVCPRTALTQMTDDWLRETDNSKVAGALTLDFSAAFDVIDRDILIEKLKRYAFSPSATTLIKSHLSSRTQRVFYNDSLSNRRSLVCGIPQGRRLGPLLFSSFIDDLISAVKNAITMYADDSTVYYAATTRHELNQVLSSELNIIYDWIKTNKLALNISKTKGIVFGPRAQNRAARLVLRCFIRSSTGCTAASHGSPLSKASMVILFSCTLNSKMVYCNNTHKHSTRFAGNGHIVVPGPKTHSLKKTFTEPKQTGIIYPE